MYPKKIFPKKKMFHVLKWSWDYYLEWKKNWQQPKYPLSVQDMANEIMEHLLI